MTNEEVKTKVNQFVEEIRPFVDVIRLDYLKGSHWFETQKGEFPK